MNRFLCIVLAIALNLIFTACSADPNNEVKIPESGNVDGGNAVEGNKETEITIEEAVLVDEQGVKITAKSLSGDEIFGPELNLLIENNAGKDLTFQCRNASVNGYMVDTMMSVDVADGKKANDTLTFMNSDLELSGIRDIADMEISFHIFDSNWNTYLDTPQIQIKTSTADSYNYVYDDSGELAFEGNGIKVVVKGLDETSSFVGPGIVVYIANKSDKDITLQVRDVSVNGYMVDAIFSPNVLSGKHCIDTIAFMSSDLEANNITEIDNVELSFHIFEESSWDTIVDTDPVIIKF